MEFYELEPLIEHLHSSTSFRVNLRRDDGELTTSGSSCVPREPCGYRNEEGSHLHVRLERLPKAREESDE